MKSNKFAIGEQVFWALMFVLLGAGIAKQYYQSGWGDNMLVATSTAKRAQLDFDQGQAIRDSFECSVKHADDSQKQDLGGICGYAFERALAAALENGLSPKTTVGVTESDPFVLCASSRLGQTECQHIHMTKRTFSFSEPGDDQSPLDDEGAMMIVDLVSTLPSDLMAEPRFFQAFISLSDLTNLKPQLVTVHIRQKPVKEGPEQAPLITPPSMGK